MRDPVELEAVHDRFLGTVVGLAVGDALGGPLQGATAASASRFLDAQGWDAGRAQTSDDTALALLWLESLAEHGRVDPGDAALRLVAWLRSGPTSVGKLTASVISRLAAGTSHGEAARAAWEESGRSSAGNGSVMCCAPIGLLHVLDLRNIADDAAAASRLTHHDPRCVAACRAVTMSVALLAQGKHGEVFDRATLLSSPAPAVREAVERGRELPPGQLVVDGSDSGYCARTVEIAFSALFHASGFEEGMRAVLSRGGDSDTNGAVAGALLGAHHGLASIPSRWQEALAQRGRLIDAADQLWARLTAP